MRVQRFIVSIVAAIVLLFAVPTLTLASSATVGMSIQLTPMTVLAYSDTDALGLTQVRPTGVTVNDNRQVSRSHDPGTYATTFAVARSPEITANKNVAMTTSGLRSTGPPCIVPT